MRHALDLADYRRRVASLYAGARDREAPLEVRHRAFREARDRLFATHPMSPLPEPQRASFEGLAYFPYDPDYRLEVVPDYEVEPESFEVQLRDDGAFRMTRIAGLPLTLAGAGARLSLFWIEGYGGGLFLPFRDETCGRDTYGGGRYLLDTLKHADLGRAGEALILDFNFAYYPSCAYSPTWECPLAPPENRLAISVVAGEKDRR